MTGSPPYDDEGEAEVADVMNAFSFDSARKSKKRGFGRKRRAESVEPSEVHAPLRDEPEPSGGEAVADPHGPASVHGTEMEDPSTLIRPYTWTGGRTRSAVDLQLDLETLVSSRPGHDGSEPSQFEHRSIATLCHHPHSVAEVAAKLGVPLGVARVLLSDMAELGYLVVHKTVDGDDRVAHFNLMERVLSGLRRL